ncbi:MAG TPA: DUF5318 family protein [Acidimicrobiales bacterium]|nr:DUF5318 family protein [Acidimicrobiales bacterium]
MAGRAVTFRPESVQGAGGARSMPGQIDYRLARNSIVKEFRRGRLSRQDVCDAHPELLRVANGIGRPAGQPCPICAERTLVHVSYAFGPRLPPGGAAFADAAELAKLTRRAGDVACYVVEVCPACSWNHLVRTYVAGRRRRVSST